MRKNIDFTQIKDYNLLRKRNVYVYNNGGHGTDEIKRYIELAKEQTQDDIQMIRLTTYRDQVQVEYETVMKNI